MATEPGSGYYRTSIWRGGTTWLAIAAVVLIALLVGAYFYYSTNSGTGPNTFDFPASFSTSRLASTVSTTATAPAVPDQVVVQSAVVSNGTLALQVQNKGPSATSALTITSLCTPGFLTCYDYKGMEGAYYRIVFDLPAKRTFLANLTGVCMMPIPSCRGYYPVFGSSYYLQVRFSFADGQSATVPVAVRCNSTWSRYPTAISNVSLPVLTTFPKNLSGLFSVTVTVNSSLTDLCTKDCVGFTTILDGYLKPGNGFSGTILTNNTITCGGNSTFDCTVPLTANVRFSTVLYGVSSGPYYAIIVRDTTNIVKPPGLPTRAHAASFALWVQGT